jgi:hypothetical protein
MLRQRQKWVLLAIALIAFAGFLILGEREGASPPGGEDRSFWRGLLGAVGIKKEGVPGSEATRAPASSSTVVDPGAEKSRNLSSRAKRARLGGKAQGVPLARTPPMDPAVSRGLGLGDSGAPDARRQEPEGSWRSAGKPGFAGDVTGLGGQATLPAGGGGARTNEGESSPLIGTPEEDAASVDSEPRDCSPKIHHSLLDVGGNPSIFQTAAGSSLVNMFGERFNVGDAPAFILYFPESERGSGGALFDERYFVMIRGECIPDGEFLKSALRN